MTIGRSLCPSTSGLARRIAFAWRSAASFDCASSDCTHARAVASTTPNRVVCMSAVASHLSFRRQVLAEKAPDGLAPVITRSARERRDVITLWQHDEIEVLLCSYQRIDHLHRIGERRVGIGRRRDDQEVAAKTIGEREILSLIHI